MILHVLRLYYEHDLTQAEVAHRIGFSRPKVTRLIAEGKARGLVRVTIAEPTGGFTPLEIALEDRYGLDEALVVAGGDNRQSTELAAGGVCGSLLDRLCSPESTLGVSWGVSLRAVADALPHRAFPCKKILPLVGGMGKVKSGLHSNQIGSTLANKLGAEQLHLSAPAIARSSRSRDELMETPGIGKVLEEAASCDVALVGIGGILPTSTMVGAGYFSLEEFLSFRERGAAGDVCCHFLDASGEPCIRDLSARIVGVTLEQLRGIPKTVGVATGAEKAPGVAAILRGGYTDILVCDRALAEVLLDDNPEDVSERIELP